MAQTMEAEVVAEGVETREQLQMLADLGCRRAQGYFIGAPLEVDQIPAAVRDLEDRDSWMSRLTR